VLVVAALLVIQSRSSTAGRTGTREGARIHLLQRLHVAFVVKCLPDKDVYRVFVLAHGRCPLVVLADISRLYLLLQVVLISFVGHTAVANLVAGEELWLSIPIRL